MITVFNAQGQHIIAADALTPTHLADALWIDLLHPQREEETGIEAILGVQVPTREEMQEIETTSRLYEENGALYMTATVVAYADTGSPISTAVTFIVTADHLLTVRYAEPSAFKMAAAQFGAKPGVYNSSAKIAMLLLETLIDRLADLLERANEHLDTVSARIFSVVNAAAVEPAHVGRRKAKPAVDFRDVLINIGRNGDLIARIRESLTSLMRIYSYLGEGERLPQHNQHREALAAIKTDLASLSEHAAFLTNKTGFLLDATLGMVSIEQNNIIKAMSIAATVFLPPTLIASAYGMNFDFMPELHFHWAYPVVLGLMVVSGALPYWFFKRKGWV